MFFTVERERSVPMPDGQPDYVLPSKLQVPCNWGHSEDVDWIGMGVSACRQAATWFIQDQSETSLHISVCTPHLSDGVGFFFSNDASTSYCGLRITNLYQLKDTLVGLQEDMAVRRLGPG